MPIINPPMEEMLRQRKFRENFENTIPEVPNDDSGTPGVDKKTGVRLCPKCGDLSPKSGCVNCFHSVTGTVAEDPFEPNPEATIQDDENK